ncbi:MAG TPA: hypothetical protein VNZ52_10240 [Candidatus Thermoplasmatota archaeon]|nr:hypothetical protein [Candidatus Thermoplasmatota archaeon]
MISGGAVSRTGFGLALLALLGIFGFYARLGVPSVPVGPGLDLFSRAVLVPLLFVGLGLMVAGLFRMRQERGG